MAELPSRLQRLADSLSALEVDAFLVTDEILVTGALLTVGLH